MHLPPQQENGKVPRAGIFCSRELETNVAGYTDLE
jgi:hypothetical protein